MLSGTAQNSNFRGFIIQAQRVADDSPVGQFMNGNNYQPRCMDNVGFIIIDVKRPQKDM